MFSRFSRKWVLTCLCSIRGRLAIMCLQARSLPLPDLNHFCRFLRQNKQTTSFVSLHLNENGWTFRLLLAFFIFFKLFRRENFRHSERQILLRRDLETLESTGDWKSSRTFPIISCFPGGGGERFLAVFRGEIFIKYFPHFSGAFSFVWNYVNWKSKIQWMLSFLNRTFPEANKLQANL